MNQHYFDIPFAFAGDVSSIPDPLQVGGSVSMTEGWNFNYQRDLSTDPAARPIDRSTMNWLLLQVTTALQALQQSSTAEFITAAQNGGVAFSYGLGSVVLWSASGNAPFVKYVSISSANTNTPSAGDPQGLTTGWQTVADAISTAAQATAGTNDYSIMTPLKVAQQTALRALLAGSSSQVFNVGAATTATQAPQATQVQASAFNYAGVAGGTANALTATLAPAPASYTDDLVVVVRVLASNTTTATLNLNGLGATAIVGAGHVALQGGELIATGFACFAYSTSLAKFVLLWSTGGGEQVGNATQSQHALTAGQAISQSVIAFTTAGTAPAYTLTPTIPLTAYTANQRFRVKFNAAGTTGSNTLNISGLGAVTLGQFDSAGSLLPANVTSGMVADVEYNGSVMIVLDPLPSSIGVVGTARNLSAVNGTSGSATATWGADEIVVESVLGGSAYKLSSFSKVLNVSTTGAGGMDTGAAPTSGWLAVYAIYNPSTNVSALLGVNATSTAAPNIYGGANMPSGYSASALISVVPTTAAALMAQFTQRDRSIGIVNASAYSATSIVAFSGFSTGNVFPKNATTISGFLGINNAAAVGTVTLAISLSEPAVQFIGYKQLLMTAQAGTTGASTPFDRLKITSAQTIYLSTSTSGAGGGTPTFSVTVSGYEI